MELDKILYKESSLRDFYNYTIKFPTEEKYIQRDFLTLLINLCKQTNKEIENRCSRVSRRNNYYVVEFPGGIIIM
jgi:hypothetical protein